MGKIISNCIIVGEGQVERHIEDQHQIPIFEKWLIEVWGWKFGKPNLQDIIEFPYDTEPLALQECVRRRDEDLRDNKSSLEAYAERLQCFVMDETTEDREPHYPDMINLKYIPKKYLVTMRTDGMYCTILAEL